MRALPALAGLLAVAALIGWAFHVDALRSLIAGRVPMQPQTSFALLTGAAGVAAHLTRRVRAARLLGLALVAVGGATLIDYALHGTAAMTHLARGPTGEWSRPGPMALQTAGCVLVLGIGLLMSHPAAEIAARIRELAALAVAAFAYVGLVGHVFGARTLWIFATDHMAANTALALLALALALIVSPPFGLVARELVCEEEGGYVARRLLPIALTVPVAIGWVRILGEEAGRFDLPDGATLIVVLNTGLFVAATWWVARVANRVASERASAHAALRETEIERDLRARFVQSLAHDLRTPLASIRAGTDRLTRSSSEDPDSAPISMVVRRGVDRLERMITDLLDVERIRAGGAIAIAPEPADAGEIVDGVVKAFRVVHGDRLVASVDHPIHGSWDRQALERILENLVSNAFKYGDPRGVVRVSARDEGAVASFEVHNDGPPIPSHEVSGLFEPFRRGVDTRGQKGWGLGLPLVGALCTASGGRVEVESSARDGTTFRAILPKPRDRRSAA